MKIGLIDVDGHSGFPNLALMKISAWHKAHGDTVRWCRDGIEYFDRVYMSKVFSSSAEPDFYPNSPDIRKGGTGYCISLVNGKEFFDREKNQNLPPEIEHIYPDYALYGITNTAYGFMSRGCPKGNLHTYCHVAAKEGLCSVKVADLSEFWNGQKYIKLLDPNTLACRDAEDILQQLIESRAEVDFTQGVDIQLLTDKTASQLEQIRIKRIHFAWDDYRDKHIVVPRFETLKRRTGWDHRKASVYVLTNFDTTTKQDLERIYFLRSIDFQPYPMIYNKHVFFDKRGRLRPRSKIPSVFTDEQIQHAVTCRRIQRWCNPYVFWQCEKFEDYKG